MRPLLLAIALGAIATAATLSAHATTAPPSLDELAADALSGVPARAEPAIAALRLGGQPAVDALLRRANATCPMEILAVSRTRLAKDCLTRAGLVIDRVARQLHTLETGLYWYTDLDLAQAEAKRTGKPILSLRLLGHLDEEFSCANSRFFRATLYPDERVRARLHDQFVLHWQPVRDTAPRITIDLGGGRVIERTITGNSLHLVLDADGHPVEVMPGLVGASAFADWLDHSVALLATTRHADLTARRPLRASHARDHQAALRAWQAELAAVGVKVPRTLAALLAATGPAQFEAMARRRLPTVALGAAPREIIAPTAVDAAPLAVTKMRVERPILPAIRNIEGNIARDEVQNAVIFRTQVLGWLAAEPAIGRDALVERIYRELFLSPLDDPDFGLVPPDIYTGITTSAR